MTLETMKAGKKLDALIAEKVMGWLPHCRNSAYYVKAEAFNSVGEQFANQIQANINDWRPSEDMAAAWQVAERVKLFQFCDITQGDDKWWIDNVTHDWQVEAPTAALAICRAALKMVADNCHHAQQRRKKKECANTARS